jgi:polyhydroxyalkanoate synthesis regulator phasin
MATTKKTEEAAAAAEDIARKIWLAGVGAYGRMFAEAQDRVEKAAGSANELFDQLVKRGEVLENAVRDRLAQNESTQKAAEFIGKVQDFRAEQRAALKSRVETIRTAAAEAIAPFNPLALAREVEDLKKRVAALEGAKAAKPEPAPAKAAAPKPAPTAAKKLAPAKKTAKK